MKFPFQKCDFPHPTGIFPFTLAELVYMISRLFVVLMHCLNMARETTFFYLVLWLSEELCCKLCHLKEVRSVGNCAHYSLKKLTCCKHAKRKQLTQDVR